MGKILTWDDFLVLNLLPYSPSLMVDESYHLLSNILPFEILLHPLYIATFKLIKKAAHTTWTLF